MNLKDANGKYVITRKDRRLFMKMVFALIVITLLGKACGLDKEKKTTGFVDNSVAIVTTVEMSDNQF